MDNTKWGEKAIIINYTKDGKRNYAYVRLRNGNATPGDYYTVYQMEINWLPNKHLNLNTFSSYSDLKENATIGSTLDYNKVRSKYNTAKKAKDYRIVC